MEDVANPLPCPNPRMPRFLVAILGGAALAAGVYVPHPDGGMELVHVFSGPDASGEALRFADRLANASRQARCLRLVKDDDLP